MLSMFREMKEKKALNPAAQQQMEESLERVIHKTEEFRKKLANGGGEALKRAILNK